MSELTEKIRQLHASDPGLTQKRLAKRCHTSEGFVCKVLNDRDDIMPAATIPDVKTCERCGMIAGGVVDSRPSSEGYRIRRRKCANCGFQWATYETILKPVQVSHVDEFGGLMARLSSPDAAFVLRLARMLASGDKSR